MTPYEQVESLLHSAYGWISSCAPAPLATAKALETMTPDEVAEALHAYVLRTIGNVSPAPVAPGADYAWAVRAAFRENKEYWEHATQLAFGFITELPVDTIGKPNSLSQWWDWQSMLRNHLGEKLCSQEEFDRRCQYASVIPLEWSEWTGGPLIYQFAVREGFIPVGMTGFEPAYLQHAVRVEDVRAFSATKWFQNLMEPNNQRKPWLKDGTANPKVNP